MADAESASSGPRKASSGIDPSTGRTTTVVTGLVTPTGVAVAGNGDLYVAELYRGVISKIVAGGHKVRTYVTLRLPAAVEVTPTGLLATSNSVPTSSRSKGQVITITP